MDGATMELVEGHVITEPCSNVCHHERLGYWLENMPTGKEPIRFSNLEVKVTRNDA